MGKVQFQVDGLDSNTASIFNADATFDGNVDANSISIAGTDLFNLLPSGTTYANTEPSSPVIGQVWIDADSSVTSLTQNDLLPYALLESPTFTGTVTANSIAINNDLSVSNLVAQSITVSQETVVTAIGMGLIGNSATSFYVNGISTDPSGLGTTGITISGTPGGIADGTYDVISADQIGFVLAAPGISSWASFDGSGTETFTLFKQGSLVTDVEIGYLDGVTSAIQVQLNTKSPVISPTFTGTVSLPSTTSVGNVSATELGYLDGVTSAIQTQLDTKAPTSNPTFAGTVIADAISTSGSGISGSLFSNITSGTAVIGTALTSGGVSIAPGTSFNGTVSIATGGISSGTRTVNIGTGQATGATTNINLGSSNGTSVVSINSELAARKSIKTGTNSFAKTLSNGDIALDNGSTDTPGIMFYDANNTNFGIDVSTGLRFVRNLNEVGGSVMGSFDTSGNLNIGASLGIGSNLSVVGTINGATINNNAWTSFTPTLSTENGAWTIGNGVIEAAYKAIGKTCHFRVKIVWGTTTSASTGALLIGLPLTAANTSYQFPVSILDTGLAWYQATGNGMYINNTSKFAMIFKSSTGSSSEGITGTSPFTFGNGDYVSLSGTYEVE